MLVTREKVENEIRKLGLHGFLKAHGVSSTILKKSQLLTSHDRNELSKYYDKVKEVEFDSKVDTELIDGINREVNNLSWFKIVNYAIYGVPKGIFLNMSTLRFFDQLAVLSELNLSGYNDYFQSHYSFDFACYIDSNHKHHYYLSGDGNHRITIAKLLDLKYVNADKLIIYKYNPEKFHQLESYELSVAKLNSLLSTPLFKFTTYDGSIEGGVELDINTLGKHFSKTIRIKTYSGSSTIILNSNALHSDEIISQSQKVDNAVTIMKKIQKDHNHFVKVYKYYPMRFKKLLFETYIFLNENMAFDGKYDTYHKRLAKLSALTTYFSD
ncbi:hypothetical protein [Leuconostoc pseudomesenteroides]|uniref:hypothetical protein n=1 Tax=Leuconostoc pseudomesenteroides TaxID=33968 RepID=UPI0022863275|nr:hypothetical protein [Leuconostoc pseudomesenteroides]WAM37745.1 hypothetical protein OYT93_05935 [Leuconostoc pseudomesenteroides]